MQESINLPFLINLEDKVAVITGAGGILCSMFAHAVAKSGAKVALLDLNLEAAEAVAKSINAQGGTAYAYKADVLNKEALEAVHAEVVRDLGLCDILINGAGGNSPKATTTNEYYEPGVIDQGVSFFELEKAGVDFVFGLNFTGTLIPTQVFAKDMLEKEGCSIINISSMNAFTPLTKIPAYSAAKAAISNFTQWLAVHFSKAGIRVNGIAPGFFVTAQNMALLYNEDGTATARTNKILNATPMGRFGEAAELIGTLLYLLSPEASGFVNGAVIPVDGGFSAYSGV